MKKIKFLALLVLYFLCFTGHTQNWIWAKQATGDGQEDGYGIAVDKDGNTYITGEWSYCNGGQDTAVFGSYSLKYPDKDYLVKYDPNGNVLWARSATGDKAGFNWVQGYAVTTDNNDNVYEIGSFADTANFGPYQIVATPTVNSYLVKYDANGTVLWVKAVTGTVYAVTADASNNIYVTGAASGNIILVKYGPNGNVIWNETSVSSCPNFNNGFGITTDALRNVFVTGEFGCSSVSFGSSTLTNNANFSVFLVKYDSNGNVLWARASKEIAGADNQANTVIIDRVGDIIISGSFLGDSVTFGSFTLGPETGAVFIVKYDQAGNVLWASSIASQAGETNGYSLATDKCNDVYVSGGCGATITSGSFSYTVPNYIHDTNYTNAPDPSFVMEFDCAGNPITGFVLPDGGDDYIGIVMDKNQNLILGGDLIQNMGFGTDTLKPFCAEAAFISKFTFGQTECCKNILVSISDSANNGTAILTAHPSNSTYIWNTGATTQSITLIPTINQAYSVYVVDSVGCSCSAQADIGPASKCGEIFIPNAFSPSGDGQNDILFVRGDCINTMDFLIFDRWGNKVFESENVSDGWDGKHLGLPMNTGTYVWYFKATMQDGSLVDKKGSVELIR